MADHQELVTEMSLLEKISTQERLKLARKRRVQQLKKWSQREKEYATKRKKNETVSSRGPKSKRHDYKVHFVPSVMLLEAAARSDIDEVRRLLMLGVSPDSTNEDGLTALHQCCIDDSEEMMKLLIEFGSNVNAKDSEQWTPLHAAATCGHLHLVKYLISKGANLLAVNADGNMPYDICEDEVTLDYIESEMAKKGITQEMIDETRASTESMMLSDLKALAEACEDLEYRDSLGATPLHIASANGYLSAVEFLLDHHVSTDVVDNDLWQPVHAAACWGHPDVLEALVQAGADLEAKTKNGETPLEICEDPELKERIVQLKSEMDSKRASHTNKLKRSHSSNTRSQSVRRTSIREKSQISRREAREEARLRQQKQETGQRNGNDEDDDSAKVQFDGGSESRKEQNTTSSSLAVIPTPSLSSSTLAAPIDVDSVELLVDGSNGKSTAVISPTVQSSLSNSKTSNSMSNSPQKQLQIQQAQPGLPPKQQEGPPTNGLNISKVDHKEAVVIRNSGFCERDATANGQNGSGYASQSASDSSPSSLPRGNSGESVKVEIHVTVNTTPTYGSGTLADLKKQRADMRHRGSVHSNSPSDSPTNDHTRSPQFNGTSSRSMKATYMLDGPQANTGSPTNTLKKFRGDPSEVVGDIHKKGCCIIC